MIKPSLRGALSKRTEFRLGRCYFGIAGIGTGRTRQSHALVALRYLNEVARLDRSPRRRVAEHRLVGGQPTGAEARSGDRHAALRAQPLRRPPTAAGEFLLRHIRETVTDYQRTLAEIAGLSGVVTGAVRIISLKSLAVRFMPSRDQELSARYPQVNFTVLVVDPGEIADELRSERNDFGVLFVDRRFPASTWWATSTPPSAR